MDTDFYFTSAHKAVSSTAARKTTLWGMEEKVVT